jgi:hypothetical protein
MESVKPDNRSAWEQQRGESEESFAGFVVFRDLGPARTLAEAQRLMGETQEGCKRTPKKRHASGCLKRLSKRRKWFDRATARDAMGEAERTAAIVAAKRREGEKWVNRSFVFREKAWEELQDIVVVIKQLVKRPIMQVNTIRRALPNAKTEADAWDLITVLNPALDTMRAIHLQTELAQLCFGDVNLNDAGPDGTTEKLTDEVTEGEMKSVKPDNRSAWEQQRGESAESFAGFVVFRNLGPARILAEAQRLMGETQKDRKRTPKNRRASGCMKRRSKRWNWFDRATAWDAMLDAERTTAIFTAMRREGEKWAGRWLVFREDAWVRFTRVFLSVTCARWSYALSTAG